MPLLSQKMRVIPIFIDEVGRWLHEGRQLWPATGGFITEGGERIEIDCAIPLLHGDYGEDGIVQGALECANIPYIGCDVSASALCRDKSIVKIIAEHIGIPTLPHRIVGVGSAHPNAEHKIPLPAFVKPARLGSSIGAMAAYDEKSLGEAIESALSLCERVIVEPCLTDKRELECGYFSDGKTEIFTEPGEIHICGSYSYEKKYHAPDLRLSPVADLPTQISEKIREYSARLVHYLGVRHLSRVDFFLSGEQIYFNEINTMPGFTSGSLYGRMMSALGIDEGELMRRLCLSAIGR
jgi:D-alanine-D-alanine ligase